VSRGLHREACAHVPHLAIHHCLSSPPTLFFRMTASAFHPPSVAQALLPVRLSFAHSSQIPTQPRNRMLCRVPHSSHRLRVALGISRHTPQSLQHLHHHRRIRLLRLADQQVHVLRHHHIPDDCEPIAPPHFIKNDQKRIPRPHRPQKRQSPITTETNEMQLRSPIAALEILRHRSKSTPTHPSQTQRRVGHPQKLRLNFRVICPSGTIRTEAPSIVETTDTKRTRVGMSPYIAFAALTLAMGIGVFGGARYSQRIRSISPVLYVVAGYGLVCFPLWAHYALSLGIGRPEAVVAGTWIGEGF
jgi:hypothetical protein